MKNPVDLEQEKFIDLMYDFYLKATGKDGLKRQNPSREAYGEIVECQKLFRATLEALDSAKISGGADDTKQN